MAHPIAGASGPKNPYKRCYPAKQTGGRKKYRAGAIIFKRKESVKHDGLHNK